MLLFTGAPTKKQLSTKRPLYDEYKDTEFVSIPLEEDFTEVQELPTELYSTSESSRSTIKPRMTSFISHKSIKSLESAVIATTGRTTTTTQRSDVSISNPPLYNFSVNSLTNLESIYLNGHGFENEPINVLAYLISVEVDDLTLRNGLRMTRFNLTAIDEAGFPIEISIFDKEGRSDEDKCRKGDIVYLQGTRMRIRDMDGIPTPMLTNGAYTVCYRFNVGSRDKNWRAYRTDWLATHRPSIRVLKLYEWVESNL